MPASATLHVNKLVERQGWLRFEYRPDGVVWRKLGPVQPVYSKEVPEATYTRLMQEVNRVLRESDPETRPETFETLGRLLYNNLVPEGFRPRLLSYHGAIDLWTNTVAIPWELIYDGEEFWGKRYALGRTIRMPSDQPPLAKPASAQQRLTVLLVAANPLDDLPYAEKEVKLIADILPGTVSTKVLVGPRATDIELMAELNRGIYDIIHYSGHVVVDPNTRQSALLLNGGILLSSSVRDNLHGAPFVFINGCRPDLLDGNPSKWHVDDWDEMNRNISDGFIFGGAIGVIATLNKVGDLQAKQFSECFYELVLKGEPFGESLRAARSAITEGAGWASFVLFGDPNLSIQHRVPEEPTPEPAPDPPAPADVSLFASDGSLNATIFHANARDILAKAAKDMRTLGDTKIEPFHLFMGLTRSRSFFALFRHISGDHEVKLAALLKLLRGLVRRTYNKSIEVENEEEREPLRNDIHEQTLAILRVAQDLEHGQLIGEKHILVALLRNAPVELLQVIEQSGITVSDFLRNAETFSFSSTQKPLPSEREVWRYLRDTTSGKSTKAESAPLEPHPLFTAEGRLREEKLAPGVRALLELGRGYGEALQSEALQTPSLFLALLENPEGITNAAVHAQNVEPVTIRRALCDDRSPGSPRRVRQQVCSSRTLRILQHACKAAAAEGKLIGEAHLLLGVLSEQDGPTFKALKECGLDPRQIQSACQLN
ncbi:MAG: CHAT domain-containing protein [Deltaproteobacteria bacterium]|nr:CHAT domain-containing protein [Deltaproteobacteria bacterium]